MKKEEKNKRDKGNAYRKQGFKVFDDGFILSKGEKEQFYELIKNNKRMTNLINNIISRLDKRQCLINYFPKNSKLTENRTFIGELEIVRMIDKDSLILLELEDFIVEGTVDINANCEIIKIEIERHKAENDEKTGKYFLKTEISQNSKLSWPLFRKNHNTDYVIYFNNFYDAKFSTRYTDRKWWESIKINSGSRFIRNNLAFIAWQGLLETLADEGNWFLKDYISELEKYDRTCERWQNLTEIPVELNDLKGIKSKSEFLEKFTTRKNQPKNRISKLYRKMPIVLAYNLLKLKIDYQPVLEECAKFPYEILKCFSNEIGSYHMRERKRHFIFIKSFLAASYLRQGMEPGKKNALLMPENFFFIEDTLNMIDDLKNIEWKRTKDFPSLQRYHNKLVKEQNLKRIERIPERKLKLGKKFKNLINNLKENRKISKDFSVKVIDNEKRLFLEGQNQQNCVYTYLKSIENGKCLILSCKYNGKAYTAEIEIKDRKYHIRQFLGKYNSFEGTDEPRSMLQKLIENIEK